MAGVLTGCSGLCVPSRAGWPRSRPRSPIFHEHVQGSILGLAGVKLRSCILPELTFAFSGLQITWNAGI